MSEWSKYSDVLKEGFVKCKDYLRNRYDLLEKASVTLKDSFSVDFILSYCLDVNKFPDGSFKDRQMFTKEVFEIYFGYCKNILLYFDIYSQKSITETTPQVVNYLSKIPNFSDHLALIGYHYQDDCNEWKYTESRLTKERREILQLITVCCCLGHNYLDSPFKMEENRKRQTISITDKQRLIKAYESSQDWGILADEMGICKYTAKSIIYTWRKFKIISKGKIGGHKKPIITPIIGESLIKFVESNTLATFKDMKTFLQSNFQIEVSKSTIWNFLNNKCITVKKNRDFTDERNSSNTKEKRRDYVKYLWENAILPEECIYIGETSLNLWVKKSLGKSKNHKESDQTFYGHRGVKISLYMAISVRGVLHYKIIDGGLTFSIFQEFIDELSGIVLKDKLFFIMDYCQLHSQITIENSLHSVKYLPPYSSFLNPIEGIFKDILAKVKTTMNENAIPSGIDASKRHDQLMDVIKTCITSLDETNFKNHYKQSISFYASCIYKDSN